MKIKLKIVMLKINSLLTLLQLFNLFVPRLAQKLYNIFVNYNSFPSFLYDSREFQRTHPYVWTMDNDARTTNNFM